MSQQDQNFDKIEDYLFNKMGSADKTAFENEVNEDANLAAECDFSCRGPFGFGRY